MAGPATSQFTRTATDGGTSVGDLRHGSYLVTAAAQGYSAVSQEVMVESGGVVTLEIRLQPLPATLSGTVTHVVSGTPVAGVRVIVGDRSTKTDNDGWYRFDDVAPGVYAIRVELEGFQAHEATVAVDPGAQRTFNATLTPLLGTLRIRVVNASTGQPIEGAVISYADGDQLPCADYGLLVPLKRSRAYGVVRKRVADLKPVDAWLHDGLHFFNFALKPLNGINGHLENGAATTLETPAAHETSMAVFAMYPGLSQPVSAVVVTPRAGGAEPHIEDLRQVEIPSSREIEHNNEE